MPIIPGRKLAISSALLSSPDLSSLPPDTDFAARFGVSRIYVRKIRESLIRSGKLPNKFRQPRVGRASLTDDILQGGDISSIQAAIESKNARPMSLDERRLFLSELARLTRREEIKVQAMSALNRLESTVSTTDDLGPPDPISATEADERITALHIAREQIFGGPFKRRQLPA